MRQYQNTDEGAYQMPVNTKVKDVVNKVGTIVGFRCPPFVKGINVPGYHLHFIKSDFTQGGCSQFILAPLKRRERAVYETKNHHLVCLNFIFNCWFCNGRHNRERRFGPEGNY